MATFRVLKEYETANRSGSGVFQIASLERLNDDEYIDVSYRIDVGIPFQNDRDLKVYLAEVFRINIDNIELEED